MAKIDKKEMRRLVGILKTDQAIADRYGITRQAVNQLRLIYGIKANAEKHHSRNKRIIRWYKKGMTGEKIAAKFEMAVSHVYRILNLSGN